MDNIAKLRQHFTALYDAFNRRDIDEVLTFTAPEIEWENGWDGGLAVGQADVVAYWTDQFAVRDPRVTVTYVSQAPDGRVAVTLHNVVYDIASGDVVFDGTMRQIFTLSNGLITRMQIDATA